MKVKKTIDGTTYHYVDEGVGEVVVLLHGFTGTVHTWDVLTVSLVEAGYRVIRIDLLGHGQTTTIDENHSMKSVCQNLYELLQSIGVKNSSFIGYSQGGRVALSFALYHPMFVHKLILESASPGIEEEVSREKRRLSDERLAEKICEEGLAKFIQHWEETPLFGTQRSLDETTRQKIREERMGQTEAGLALALRRIGAGAQPSWWEKLPGLKVKTLLIIGSEDIKFVKVNNKMNEILPCSRIEGIMEAGHAVHIEKPVQFNEAVRIFLLENN